MKLAIAEMKFINILGSTEDFDYAVYNYVNTQEIQLESAMQEMKNIRSLRAMETVNTYAPLIDRADKVMGKITPIENKMDAKEAMEILNKSVAEYKGMSDEIQVLNDEITRLDNTKNILNSFRQLDFDLKLITSFEFVYFRFGKMPKDIKNIENVFKPYEKSDDDKVAKYYMLDNKTDGNNIAVFIPSFSDRSFIWGIYFSPKSLKAQVDSLFSSLHFERQYVTDEALGNPMEMFSDVERRIAKTKEKLSETEIRLENFKKEQSEKMGEAYYCVKMLSKLAEVRKYAAESKLIFYIVGWMKKEEAEKLYEKSKNDNKVNVIIEDDSSALDTKPPTELKNPVIFRPFEMYLKLYGLPSYKDIDPTIFLTISFVFLFGIMFGDVGQGVLLVIAGLFMYKKKGSALGGIISLCGVMSMVFGFMYGSIFGNEEILTAIWLKPSHNIMTILLTTVAIGAVIELFVMFLNIINSIKKREYGNAVFSQNGVAGFMFYLTVIMTVVSIFTGGWLKKPVIASIVIITLVLIFLKEPIERKIKGEKKLFEESAGIFMLQSFFELFEIILSYITNTISFIRVGAFALSHAGMMTVVYILMDMAGKGTFSYYLVFAFGNLLVIGLEGLIVSIQVLRLEFYEMFGRFFSGSGRAFEPTINFHKQAYIERTDKNV